MGVQNSVSNPKQLGENFSGGICCVGGGWWWHCGFWCSGSRASRLMCNVSIIYPTTPLNLGWSLYLYLYLCVCICICPSCIFVFLCLYFIFVQPDVFLDLESRCLYCVDLIGEGQVQSIGSLDQPYSATFTKHQGFPPTNCFVCFKFVSFFKYFCAYIMIICALFFLIISYF